MQISIKTGVRPNFIKITPSIQTIKKAQGNEKQVHYRLVNTGQHCDAKMKDNYFEELNNPWSDVNLKCGDDTQTEQTAAITVAFEKKLSANLVDSVMVSGDVNSPMDGRLIAKKLNRKVIPVEVGIHGGGMSRFEEINRIVTDSMRGFFFTIFVWAGENLKKAGMLVENIFFGGNVAIDTLLANELWNN